MKVTRDIILDLLPLYIAGEVSPDTRALVEEYLESDPELAKSARSGNLDNLKDAPPSLMSPAADAELRSLRRTRSLLGWQRRLYAWALALSLLPFSSVFHIEHGHVTFHFLLRDYPSFLGVFASLAITCWINYFLIRRKVRAVKL